VMPCSVVIGTNVSDSHAASIFRVKWATEMLSYRNITRRHNPEDLDLFKQKLSLPAVVFWVMTPCSDVVGHQRFGGPCCLHLQGEVDL
jgi:hypothetical protein